jgi:aminoglycoside phosphotransferase (APT) family kinase protein
VEDAIASYLKSRLDARDAVTISHLLRIPGGASRETWMFKAVWHDGGGRQSQEFILRKDPPASLLDTDREAEYAFYSSYFDSPVPVPRMRWLERDASVLGGPFFIMEKIGGAETAPRTLMEPRYEAVRPAIARRMYETLASIATFAWERTDIARVTPAPTPGTAWSAQLGHWEKIIDDNELSPQPIVRAAIRWLRANPPPPAQRVSVVHGDYRVGNFLFTTDGSITGVLDWEMAHLGDPLEDLAWSFNESWQWANDGRPGGIITVEEACRVWSEASGFTIDAHALRWWRIFCDVKCQGIWLTGTKSFQEGRTDELILPVISYNLINRQDEALLRSMGRGA